MSNEKVRSFAVSFVVSFLASAVAAWAVCATAPTKLKVPFLPERCGPSV
jgi:hypothetical protein